MLFDTHAHLDDDALLPQVEQVLARAKAAGVGFINSVGCSLSSSRRNVELAHKYPDVYATVGVHPSESQDMNEDLISMRKQVATVVVASYSGLKVPKSAVRMEDDKMGVYVLSNSVASYKNIEPLFEGDSYYIVEQNVTGNDSLVINDDIIVEAKDVNDKKVMK